jgi:hypothetical protein
MIHSNFCHFSGCSSLDLNGLLYAGKRYCKEHYREALVNELLSLYNAWKDNTEPVYRLKYLIGRYYSENIIAFRGKPSLTQAIIHSQSYGWKKTDMGAVFTAIRFPVNKRYWEPGEFNEVHHTWEFDVSTLTFTHLSQRKVS